MFPCYTTGSTTRPSAGVAFYTDIELSACASIPAQVHINIGCLFVPLVGCSKREQHVPPTFPLQTHSLCLGLVLCRHIASVLISETVTVLVLKTIFPNVAHALTITGIILSSAPGDRDTMPPHRQLTTPPTTYRSCFSPARRLCQPIPCPPSPLSLLHFSLEIRHGVHDGSVSETVLLGHVQHRRD